MTGLLKNNYYGACGSLRLTGLLLAALAALLLLSGGLLPLQLFALLSGPLLSLSVLTCPRRESASNWRKYLLTLPVRRRDIVNSRYLSHGIACAAGVAVTAAMIAIAVLLWGNRYFAYGLRDALTLTLSGGELALLMGAAAYPLYYLWGAERSELILALSAIGAAAVLAGLSLLVNLLTPQPVTDTVYYLSLLAMIAITLLLYAASIALSQRLFRRAEY